MSDNNQWLSSSSELTKIRIKFIGIKSLVPNMCVRIVLCIVCNTLYSVHPAEQKGKKQCPVFNISWFLNGYVIVFMDFFSDKGKYKEKRM